MKKQLEFLIQLVNELKNTTSTINKKAILKKFYDLDSKLFSKFMDYIYSFDKKYWITSTNVEKFFSSHEITTKYEFNDEQDIFDVLDQICMRVVTGHNALLYVINLINFLGENFRSILYCILEKDLKCNVNVSLINKINNNIVKEFKVSLAERFDGAPESRQVNFTDGSWMVSRKLDGVRTLAINNNGEIELYSRTGIQFATLDNLKPQIKEILDYAKTKYNKEFVLDGETCIIDNKGNENFAAIMKEITRKNHTIKTPTLIVFDLIEKNSFLSTNGDTLFSERIKQLTELNIEQFGKFVKLIPHQCNIDKKIFDKWLEQSKNEGWEGIILRNQNSIYNGKRSFDLQKVKSFFDSEYVVDDIEIGKKKMLIDGIMQEVECVKSLLINHKGSVVRVGSGISDDERVAWLNNKNEIIGKVITVQYFDESFDSKTNVPSLRFPTLKVVHGKARTV